VAISARRSEDLAYVHIISIVRRILHRGLNAFPLKEYSKIQSHRDD
jgi:hypothetical protein